MGPFEDEEEGTGITSDVVKVKGAESGHPRSPDLRNDTRTAISQYRVNKTKKHTHTHTNFKRFSQNNTQERNKHTPTKRKMDTESRVFQGGVDGGKII